MTAAPDALGALGFVGAVGVNRIARFWIDPHDERSDEDYFELVGDDSGEFGAVAERWRIVMG